MRSIQRITLCLWFDDQAEQAVDFYLSIFTNARVIRTSRYGEAAMTSTAGRRARS